MLLCPPMPRAGLDPEIVTEAAAAIVDAEGLAAMTLARLAASLRVAPPSLYKHIGGLEDLTVRVATLAIRRIGRQVGSGGDRALGRPGTSRDRGSIPAVRDGPCRALLDDPGPLRTRPPPNSGLRSRARSRCLVPSSQAMEFRTNSPFMQSGSSGPGCMGFSDIEARRGFQMTASVDESFRMLVEALDTSLHALSGRTELPAVP